SRTDCGVVVSVGGVMRASGAAYHPCLKYCTARSCFSAPARDLKVPRFLRRPVLGSFFREYSRYSPDFNLRIIALPSAVCGPRAARRRDEMPPTAAGRPLWPGATAPCATRRGAWHASTPGALHAIGEVQVVYPAVPRGLRPQRCAWSSLSRSRADA